MASLFHPQCQPLHSVQTPGAAIIHLLQILRTEVEGLHKLSQWNSGHFAVIQLNQSFGGEAGEHFVALGGVKRLGVALQLAAGMERLLPDYAGGEPMKLVRRTSFADYLDEIRPRLKALRDKESKLK